MDDLDEFLTRTTNSGEDTPSRAERVPDHLMSVKRELDRRKEEREEKHLGSLCQYARFEDGFMPTSGTIELLPPDSYKILMLQTGAVVFMPQKLTTDKLLRLPDSKSDEVIEEVQTFWTLKDKFKEYGFSHKRGFLLWGPPGSGKTSTIAIITGDMVKAGGIVLLAESPSVLTKALHDLRAIEPTRPVVVIWEDLDSVIDYFGEPAVLSVLDGDAQVENIVFIATTNYPEKLDARITNRPSRFCTIKKIGMPNAQARKLYLESKIPSITITDGDKTYDLVVESEGFSIAHLRELVVSLYCQGKGAKETLERLKKMKITPKSTEPDSQVALGLNQVYASQSVMPLGG